MLDIWEIGLPTVSGPYWIWVNDCVARPVYYNNSKKTVKYLGDDQETPIEYFKVSHYSEMTCPVGPTK